MNYILSILQLCKQGALWTERQITTNTWFRVVFKLSCVELEKETVWSNKLFLKLQKHYVCIITPWSHMKAKVNLAPFFAHN